ncbi:hypothetical protein niasHS_008304 [Heterodera schachtii]|uniref:Ribosomal protein/NADH dehydrogenase domain-containing protein n=1 Tax=Heterodera schachtii TaxID=97005 RepID=A0ABD2J154_HETSC
MASGCVHYKWRKLVRKLIELYKKAAGTGTLNLGWPSAGSGAKLRALRQRRKTQESSESCKFCKGNHGLHAKHISTIRFGPSNSSSGGEFWHRLTLPQVRATNPKMQVKVKMLSDGCRPQFVANLHDGRQVVFKTDGFQLPDLLMRLNRLLGLPAVGLRGGTGHFGAKRSNIFISHSN